MSANTGIIMARTPRREVIDESQVGVYHCINRCVRRVYLCGEHEGETVFAASLCKKLFVLIVQLNLLDDDFVPRRRQRVVLCPFLKSIAHAPGCGF